MALTTQLYTLVGFTEDLDWKPLCFVKPLPEHRLCCVCGLVRKTTALLPCRHVVCHSCFQQCTATEEHACPIDGKSCPEEDVDWRDFPAENLLKREVECWNRGRGCAFVIAASELPKHFYRECVHHCSTCPRGSTMVLCRDMGEHLKSSCNTLTARQTKECDGKIGGAEETKLVQDNRRLGEERGDLKALLHQSLRENRALNDSLSDACQNMNSLNESLRQDVVNIEKIAQRVLDDINTLRGALKNEMADTKKRNAEESSRIRAAMKTVRINAARSMKVMLEFQKKTLEYVEKNETRCDFFVPGIESLESKALEDSDSEYVHRPVYLRGYKITPGLYLLKNGDSVSLSLSLELHKGEHDDVIEWPFEHRIRFTILHPTRTEEESVILKTERHNAAFRKATEQNNNWLGLFSDQIALEHLKTCGYVCNDKLRVVSELL